MFAGDTTGRLASTPPGFRHSPCNDFSDMTTLLAPTPLARRYDATGILDRDAKGAKLALVGPVQPFRGGIAQHTTMLHRALAPRSELTTVSFRRMYPKWLFPGRSQLEPGVASGREPGVQYLLDSLNPFTWRSVCHQLCDMKPTAVIVPWWTVFWAPWCLSTILEFKRRDIPVVLICHNAVEHETAKWRERLTRKVLRAASAIIVQSRRDADRLRRLFPAKPIRCLPHPIYNQFPQPQGTLQRRAAVELLFFGFVRSYKGVDVLAEAMHQLVGADVHLSIVGEWWLKEPALRQRLMAAETASKVEIVDSYVDEQTVAEYFSRADAVVLPYRGASATGVIPLAYHYCRPVIASRVGGLPDVVQHNQTGLLVPPGDAGALARAVRQLASGYFVPDKSAIKSAARSMTWESFAHEVLDLIDQLTGHKPRPSAAAESQEVHAS